MPQLFTNNAWGTLASQLNAGATSLALSTGQGAKFPSPTGGDYFLLTLIGVTGTTETSWEIVKCTARSTDTLTIVRAQEGTSDATWAAGTRVELRVTAAPLADVGQITTLAKTDGNIIVGDGSKWVAESGATARTSLGLGTTDNPEFLTVDPTNGVRTTNDNTTAGVGNAPLYTCFSNTTGIKSFSIVTGAGADQGFKIHFPVASIGIAGTIRIRGDYVNVNAFGLFTYNFTASANNSTDYGTTFVSDLDLGTTADYISLHSITHTTGDHVFEFRRVGTNAITFTVVFDVIKSYGTITFDGQLSSAWFETFTYS